MYTNHPVVNLRAENGQELLISISTPPEDSVSMRHHFIKECEWTESQYRKIKNFPWFRVELKGMLATPNGYDSAGDDQHLGCCSYKSEEEFIKKYRADYLSDMIRELAGSISPDLEAAANALVMQWQKEDGQPEIRELPTTAESVLSQREELQAMKESARPSA